MTTLPRNLPSAGPGWPAADGRAGEIDVDLTHGVVTLAGSVFRLHATGQRVVYSLDDGARVRLPGCAERSRCVALALAAEDPPAHLLGALRGLMLDGPAGTAHDAVVLALAGGGVDAPPFSACKPAVGLAGNQELPAIEVDQALAGLSRSSSRLAAGGGWQRLVFAPQSTATLEDLVDDMLQRLLSRGRAVPRIEDPAPPTSTELPEAVPPPAVAWRTKEPRQMQPPPGLRPMAAPPAAPALDATPRSGTACRWPRRPPAGARSLDAAMAPDPRPRPDPAAADRAHHALAAAAPMSAGGAAPAAPGVQSRARWQVHGASLLRAGTPSSARSMTLDMEIGMAMAPGQGWAVAVPNLPNLPNVPDLSGVPSMSHAPLDWVDAPGPPPPAPRRLHDWAAPQAAAMTSGREAHAVPDSLDRIAWALADECDLRGIAP